MTASLHVLPNSSFHNQPNIRQYIVCAAEKASSRTRISPSPPPSYTPIDFSYFFQLNNIFTLQHFKQHLSQHYKVLSKALSQYVVQTVYMKNVRTEFFFTQCLTSRPNVAYEYAPTALGRKYGAHPLAQSTPINAKPIESACRKRSFRN
jgi:hypothetical protein